MLDLDVREVVAEFGALVSTTHTRNRFMSVDVRVGNYNLDSSNFISDEGFRGFLGPTGTVGIDRDYDSLRQDLWLATDQAFKDAVENYSRKQAYLAPRTAIGHSRFLSRAHRFNTSSRSRSGLDLAQLGAGSPRRFRRAARLPANS